MKRTAILLLSLLLLGVIAGCSEKKAPVLPIVSQDCLPGNPPTSLGEISVDDPIMETEKGYYYNEKCGVMSLHYYDKATGKDILLCNKPECRHDGNEYCAATNSSYAPFSFQFYNGSIFAIASCLDEGKLEYKLIRIAADGSSLSEVAAYYSTTLENIDSIVTYNGAFGGTNWGYLDLLIHRNKAFLPFAFRTEDMVDYNELVYGLAILDLDTQELTYAYEEPASRENAPWYNLSARGDYLFYVSDEPHKRVLHRRNILDGTDEKLELISNFKGSYTPLDEYRVAYLRAKGSKLYVKDVRDGSNAEYELTEPKIIEYRVDKSGFVTSWNYVGEETKPYEPSFLLYDGTYLYVLGSLGGYRHYVNLSENADVNMTLNALNAFANLVYVYDSDMNMVGTGLLQHPSFYLGDADLTDGNTNNFYFQDPFRNSYSLRILEGKVYVSVKDAVLVTTRDDFFNGGKNFRIAFSKTRLIDGSPFASAYSLR